MRQALLASVIALLSCAPVQRPPPEPPDPQVAEPREPRPLELHPTPATPPPAPPRAAEVTPPRTASRPRVHIVDKVLPE